jgi:hypothetical protein
MEVYHIIILILSFIVLTILKSAYDKYLDHLYKIKMEELRSKTNEQELLFYKSLYENKLEETKINNEMFNKNKELMEKILEKKE